MAMTLLQGARPQGGVRVQDTLLPVPTRSSPARVVGLIARQYLHHHTSHLLVVGDIPEPVGAQDQNVIRAVLVLREVVNPDLASNGARRKGEGQRHRGAPTALGAPRIWSPRLAPATEGTLGTGQPAARLTSGKQDRKGLMWMLELNTLRSWSPRPRVTPMVAITRAWRMAKSKENFKPLHLHLHSQLRISGIGAVTALVNPRPSAGRREATPAQLLPQHFTFLPSP